MQVTRTGPTDTKQHDAEWTGVRYRLASLGLGGKRATKQSRLDEFRLTSRTSHVFDARTRQPVRLCNQLDRSRINSACVTTIRS